MIKRFRVFVVFVCFGLMILRSAAAAESVTFIHSNIAGTPLLATDAVANVLWKENYRPYGDRINNQAAGANNDLWFANKPSEVSTGLSYFSARYYDPVAGRFMGPDPAAVNPHTAHGFIRYAYSNNNPLRYIDPDGRDSVVINNRIMIRPVDSTVPKVSIPNTVGALGVSSSSMTFHHYDVRTDSSVTNASAIGSGIAKSPTPGPGNSPASVDGTRNNAGTVPNNGDVNMVKSFAVDSPDPLRFTNITVNYTIVNEHGLVEGYVVRYGEIGANGAITLRSYGEGNNWQQSMILKPLWGSKVDEVWG